MSIRKGPLDGVLVLDLTHVLNGPFATMLLAHLGAKVIKIEHGAGDRFRHAWMPVDADHDGYEFRVVNVNKKAITLNLKDPRGVQLFRELARKADVVVENFSVGVMDRLGIGYTKLKELNPDLIYASSRGYGEDGPYAHMRANAATIMASSGWTASAWDNAGQDGLKPQGIGDEAAGVSMALGILAALFARERGGPGQQVSVSMQEALMGFMIANFHTQVEGRPVGIAPKRCADGYIAFHLPDITNDLWERFAAAMGRPEAIADPRFATAADRRANVEALEAEVSAWVRETSRDELWKVFLSIGISAGPVLRLSEVLEDEHLEARGAFVEVEDPRAPTARFLRPWVRFSETPSAITSPAPAQGQHNHEIYSELLGLSADAIDRLTTEHVL
ncbi:CaiB/BaiF CoA transferase family protein [Kribbella solani]|uniref:Crotonobetainyl-CoA:carnitine CoA-transferase CaiB-like acyl-CoA transferase n=1 Tax=Kribbella solani TaxID=236067 RepID=A0A841DUS4_9ACTN|nr:CoA transferase [Kribbella solani]MBB5980027.1 crotonobetainyl-CoA:carnitine CoA-transferase CaiB-like acyl-CoA transferase [Kribbella solani]MDX2972723.1 CoA transferase [Kribbella solani]MDX3005597.1 CoA transferase [Kribbella solani]